MRKYNAKPASINLEDSVMSLLVKSLKKDKRFRIKELGDFMVRKMKARNNFNPRTGKEERIPARKRVVFKANKKFTTKIQ